MEISRLSVSYEGRRIIEDLSLSLPQTGVFSLFGPSGCGKTTLFHAVAGLVRPEGGSIAGADGVSCVFQEYRLFPWLTARGNIEAVLKKGESADPWLSRMRLSDAAEQLPSQLSGGMCQRVSIARALAYPSDVLLLDEPFSGLDEQLREEIGGMIRREGERRLVLLITHDRQEAALADEILFFDGPPLRLVGREAGGAGL